MARAQADLLPVPYFHVVFTLPHELSALALGNRERLYGLLFECAKETLLEVAADPKHLGARIDVLMVLHTWGQQLEHHPHVHCVIPGGGLAVASSAAGAADAPRWVSCRPNWFLPVRVLGAVFRGKFLAALRASHQAGELRFAGSTLPLANGAAWDALVRTLYGKPWVVYAKEPFGSPDHVLRYLAGYTHRVALSNHRLVKLQEDRVTFTWKDYANGCRRKEMTLDAVEFVRRFAQHIVPKGLVRIRPYGLLAHRDRTARLALCRSLLSPASSALPVRASEPSPVEAKASSSRPGMGLVAALVSLVMAMAETPSSAPDPSAPVVAVDTDRCPHCGVRRLSTIWQARRPTWEERQRIPILDSS